VESIEESTSCFLRHFFSHFRKCRILLGPAIAKSGVSKGRMLRNANPMKKYKFTAKIQAGDGGGAYVFFPYDTEKEFGTKGKVPINATFDGVPYAGSLIKYGNPLHMLGMLKAIREKIGKGPGDAVEVVLWKDEALRTIEVPAQFEKLLKREGLLPVFEKLSYTHRKEYCRWITDAKKEETRLRRLTKAVEMLKKGVRTPG
jgi:Bacteriocin-protection, YdeI or OmpD-Associated/Domain of unknown function (DUF1905)